MMKLLPAQLTLSIVASLALSLSPCSFASEPVADTFQLPDGTVMEQVAGAPLVEFPMFACFDDQGRLYVAEGSGLNISGEELEKTRPCKIALLEDTDADGEFDKRTVFADKLIFPAGVLWHGGKVYVASPPGLWVFQDTDGDGRADSQQQLVTGFNHDGTGHDVHGPFMGPDGWLYWTDGLRGYNVQTQEGTQLEGNAALIWRCQPDGSDIEWLCGGGIDNPVELLFLPGGAMIGTMDQTPGDALLHYIDGGWYPSLHDDRVTELPNTGPQLGAIEQFSEAFPAALCGFCQLRSDHFGEEMKGALITSQFNVHRLQKHHVTPVGSTWKGTTSDFAISTSYDVHPTDVLEDADGSLIVVDMGAWYNYHCPNSKYARPDMKGGLYRLRRTSAEPVADPWGKQADFTSATDKDLIRLLQDARPAVRDKALETIVHRKDACVPSLIRLLAGAAHNDPSTQESTSSLRVIPSLPEQQQISAVWALNRINTPEARAAVQGALQHPDDRVRHAAAHCAGINRDSGALQQLSSMVVSDVPAVRLKAAEALGRIGASEAVPAIRSSLQAGTVDRFLEHALIYALIRLGSREHTLPLLSDSNPDARRAGIIALDQMPHGNLQRTDVAPLLDTDDPTLQQAALEVISRHDGWSDEIISLVAEWLASPDLSPSQTRSLLGAIVAFAQDTRIQNLVHTQLMSASSPAASKLLLLEAIGRCRLTQLPAMWITALNSSLTSDTTTIRHQTLNVIQARGMRDFDATLRKLAADELLPAEQRSMATGIISEQLKPMPDNLFSLLTSRFDDEVGPLDRLTAASAVSQAHLTEQQFVAVADIIRSAGPLTVPLLARAFRRCSNAKIGSLLMESLNQSPGGSGVSADDIEQLLRNFPPAVRHAAEPLLQSRAAQQQQDEETIARLFARVSVLPGDSERGRKVFFSRTAACYGCHRMQDKGGHIGPDLTRIGRVRRTIDLVEAIAVPSSTIVPGYHSYTVITVDGKTASGLIVRQTDDAVYLRTTDLSEIRIPRHEIEELVPSETSLMPKGLDKALTDQQFADLLEFLFTRR